MEIVGPLRVYIASRWLPTPRCRRDSSLDGISFDAVRGTETCATFAMPPPILLSRDPSAALRLLTDAAPGALCLRFLPKISFARFSFFLRSRSVSCQRRSSAQDKGIRVYPFGSSRSDRGRLYWEPCWICPLQLVTNG